MPRRSLKMIVTAADALVAAKELLEANQQLIRDCGADLAVQNDAPHPGENVIALVTLRAAQAHALSMWAASENQVMLG